MRDSFLRTLLVRNRKGNVSDWTGSIRLSGASHSVAEDKPNATFRIALLGVIHVSSVPCFRLSCGVQYRTRRTPGGRGCSTM